MAREPSNDYLLPSILGVEKYEDQLTEVVAFLLHRSSTFRAGLWSQVWHSREPEGDYEIRTQVGGPDTKSGVVDLLWDAGGKRLVIEAKVTAVWGGGQPTKYVRDLQKDDGNAFCLLAPGRRLWDLVPKAEAVLRSRREFCDCRWTVKEGGQAGRVRLVSVSYADIASLLGSCLTNEDAPALKTHMEEAMVVLKRVDPPYESDPDALGSPKLGPAVRDLFRLVGEVHSRAAGLHLRNSSIKAGESKEGWYYGFYIADGRFWFGLWTGPWAEVKDGNGPLWLQAMDEPAKKALRSRWNKEAVEPWEGRLLLPVPIVGKWEDMAQRVLDIITEVLRSDDDASETTV